MRASRILVASAALGLALVASPASAQEGGTTTTTVPRIPVSGDGTTVTTAPAPNTGTTGNGSPAAGLASTGVAADALVPFGFGLIAVGSALEAVARRRRLTARWG